MLSVGQEVTAKIVDFNEADRKISLSIKAMGAAAQIDQDVVPVDIEAVISAQTEE